jgi:hypothetical protein
MTEPNFYEFYKTINDELMSLKNRVSSLISHPSEKGRYREAILKSVISKFLPKKYSIGTGFFITRQKEVSTQIDIIIYDNSFPILFSEGDFVIVMAKSVKAIIEVKSSINSPAELKKIIKNSEKNGDKIKSDFDAQMDKLFNGIFAYESSISFDSIKDSLGDFFDLGTSIFTKISNISLGNNKFLHVWWSHHPFELKGYELENLSFAYFISNLLTSLDPYLVIGHESLFFPLNKRPFEKFCIRCEHNRWDGYL